MSALVVQTHDFIVVQSCTALFPASATYVSGSHCTCIPLSLTSGSVVSTSDADVFSACLYPVNTSCVGTFAGRRERGEPEP